MYYVVDSFKENERDVVVFGEFDCRDIPKKHLLLKVMQDPSKSLDEIQRAEQEYDSLMGEYRGYYVSGGMYFPGTILYEIPKNAELIPGFRIDKCENCFKELESEKILMKLRSLRSGVYHCFDGEMKDMVYEVSDKIFLDWINQHSRLEITKRAGLPVSVKDRYNMLMAAESYGFVFARIPEEWERFAEKIEDIYRNNQKNIKRESSLVLHG